MGHDEHQFELFRGDGNIAALGDLFDRVAPTMLRVALHLTRDPSTAEDLVQATFLRAIEVRGEWDGARPVVSWLLGILHNKARQARAREVRTPDPLRLGRPTPSDLVCVAENVELDEAVDAAIAEVPSPYRAVLRLHLTYGHAPAEIAHALELPAGTVRSQLARGLEKLRKLLPLGFVGSTAITMPTGRGLAGVKSVVLSKATATVPASMIKGSLVGIALMKIKSTLAVCLLALLGTAIWLSLHKGSASQQAGPAVVPAIEAPEVNTPEGAAPLAPVPRAASDRVATAAPSAPELGALHVHCVWEEDGSTAIGVLVTVREGSLLQRDARTDDSGLALFPALAPGDAYVVADRGGIQQTKIVAGTNTEVELRIPPGVHLHGKVVDQHGSPLPDARIWLSKGQRNFVDGHHVIEADRGGQFQLRSVEPGRFASAHARGYLAAAVQPIAGDVGEVVEMEFVLVDRGVSLVGTVVDSERKAIAGARVQVGANFAGSMAWHPTRNAQTRPLHSGVSDERGEFRVDGLRSSAQIAVWVRASGWSAWSGSITLEDAGQTELEVQLDRGATISGQATDGEGEPVAGAYITYRHGPHVSRHSVDDIGPSWAQGFAFSGEDGGYMLQNVPSGEVYLAARKGIRRVRGEATVENGQGLAWNPVIGSAAISGRVLDDGGAPLPGVVVRFAPPRTGMWLPSATTDDDGRFQSDRVAPTPYVLSFYAAGDNLRSRPAAKLWGIEPGGEEVLVRLPRAAIPSATISGTLLQQDGQPPPQAVVQLSGEGLFGSPSCPVDPRTGRFEIGPLCPGTYRLQSVLGGHSRHSDWSDSVELHAGEAFDVGTWTLAEPGSIAVFVSGPDGEPVDGADIALEIANEWTALNVSSTKSKKGAARIDDVAPGDYRVRARDPDSPTVYAAVSVLAGEASEVRLVLPLGVPCKLVLSKPTDPVPVRQTLIWRHNGELHERWVNNWEVGDELSYNERLAPGDWEVIVTSETGRSSSNQFRVAGDDPPSREISIRMP